MGVSAPQIRAGLARAQPHAAARWAIARVGRRKIAFAAGPHLFLKATHPDKNAPRKPPASTPRKTEKPAFSPSAEFYGQRAQNLQGSADCSVPPAK